MDEFLTIADASRLIASRKLSPVELTRQSWRGSSVWIRCCTASFW